LFFKTKSFLIGSLFSYFFFFIPELITTINLKFRTNERKKDPAGRLKNGWGEVAVTAATEEVTVTEITVTDAPMTAAVVSGVKDKTATTTTATATTATKATTTAT